MLEKKIVQYTRSGMKETDLSTGTSRMVTQSDFGREQRYQKHAPTRPTPPVHSTRKRDPPRPVSRFRNKRAMRKSRAGVGLKVDWTAPIRGVARGAFRLSRKASAMAANAVIEDAGQSEEMMPQIAGAAAHGIRSGVRAAKWSAAQVKSIAKNGITPKSLISLSRKVVSFSANATVNAASRNDDTGLQALGGTARGIRGTTRAVKWTAGRVKALQRNAAVRNIAQRAVSAAKAVGKMVASSIQKLLAKGVLLKGAMLALVFLIILNVLQALIGGIFGGIGGSVDDKYAAPELAEFVKQLDTEFLEDCMTRALDFSRYDQTQIMGVGRVNTSVADMLALLCAANDFDTALDSDSMHLLRQFHMILNSCEESEMEGEITDAEGNTFFGRIGVFIIDTYSPADRIHSFGFTPEQEELLLNLLELQEDMVGSGILKWPLRGYKTITSGYGERTHPVTGEPNTFHAGIDISAPEGTPIYAALDGVVSFAGEMGTYGNLVLIRHRDGLDTYYGHCSEILVKAGDTVKTGDPIAAVGQTGLATGPHLHFEVRVDGRHKNPNDFLK